MNYKSLGIALVMAVGLFCYGYFLSMAGHDHSAHEATKSQGQDASAGHGDHDHGDSHH